MARYIVQGIARDVAGNILEGALVKAYVANTTTLATFYADGVGTASTGVYTDSYGRWKMYFDTSDYTFTDAFDISITKSGYDSQTIEDINPIASGAVLPLLAGYVSDAQAAQAGAETAQGLAEGARDDAQGYASDASDSASNASASESTASGAAGTATSQASLAGGYAVDANLSAISASGFASDASDSADLAADYANAAGAGTYNEVTAPTTTANQVKVYAKDVSGVTELFIRKESNGTEVQVTDGNAMSGGGVEGFYTATALTGGTAGALDAINGAGLSGGDIAMVVNATSAYTYYLSASSGAAESSPWVISPDTNAGNKRWLLANIRANLSSSFGDSYPLTIEDGSESWYPAMSGTALNFYSLYMGWGSGGPGASGFVFYNAYDNNWFKFYHNGSSSGSHFWLCAGRYDTTPTYDLKMSGYSADMEMYNRIADATGAAQTFIKNRGAAGQDNDVLGKISFKGYNDAGTPELIEYAKIEAVMTDASDGSEDATLKLYKMVAGTLTEMDMTGFSGSAFEAIADTASTPVRDIKFDYEDTATYTTWSTTDKSTGVTLSNGNLTFDHGSGSAGTTRAARSSIGKSSGLLYFEITTNAGMEAGNNLSFGLANSSASLANQVGMADANGWGFYSVDGKIYNNGSGTAYKGSAWANGVNVFGVAVNFTTGKFWISIGGTWVNSGNPAAGTGEAASGLSGTLYAMVTAPYDNQQYTINVGASAFSYTPPTGFSAWDSSAYMITGVVKNASETVAGKAEIATHTEVGAGTDDERIVTPHKLAERATMKVGAFTRDLAGNNGDVSYTGVGFTPKLIIFSGGVSLSHKATYFGFSDGTNHYSTNCWGEAGGGLANVDEIRSILILCDNDGSSAQYSAVKSMDSDGFTLTWTKTETPGTMTAYFHYIAFR